MLKNGVQMVAQNAVLTSFSQSVCMAFKLLFDISPFTWHIHDTGMECQRNKLETFELFHLKDVKSAT